MTTATQMRFGGGFAGVLAILAFVYPLGFAYISRESIRNKRNASAYSGLTRG